MLNGVWIDISWASLFRYKISCICVNAGDFSPGLWCVYKRLIWYAFWFSARRKVTSKSHENGAKVSCMHSMSKCLWACLSQCAVFWPQMAISAIVPLCLPWARFKSFLPKRIATAPNLPGFGPIIIPKASKTFSQIRNSILSSMSTQEIARSV